MVDSLAQKSGFSQNSESSATPTALFRKRKQLTDSEVISLIHAGGRKREQALTFLWKSLRNAVIGYALKKGLDNDQARQVLTDGIMELDQKILDPRIEFVPRDLQPYIMGTCKNLVLQELRKMGQASLFADLDDVAEAELKIADPENEPRLDLDAILGKIGYDCREMISMRILYEYTLDKMKRELELDISVQAIKKRYEKCLEILTNLIQNV